MSVNSKMTAIANAVRDLRGMSGTMGLDAMATNINGAKTAVDAALAAISEKGVEVPAGTNVDGLAALIAAIEAGGGSGGGGVNYGTIIHESYSQTLSLGVPIPEDNFFIAILPTKVKAGSLGNLYLFHGMYRKIEGNVSAIVQSTSNSDANTEEWAIDRSANTITLSNRFFCADYEYAWFMGELA